MPLATKFRAPTMRNTLVDQKNYKKISKKEKKKIEKNLEYNQ